MGQEVHHAMQAEDLNSYDRNYLEAGNLKEALDGILDFDLDLGLVVMDVMEEVYIPAAEGMDYNS